MNATSFTAQRSRPAQRVVVAGGGFAGVWAALAAARRRHQLALEHDISVLLVSPNDHLELRPRFYERDASDARIPLSLLMDPVGVDHRAARVTSIEVAGRELTVDGQSMPYDALIWTAGSSVVADDRWARGDLVFSVDTYTQAARLDTHLAALRQASDPAASTVVIVGAGFTGIEVATELVDRVRPGSRIVLVERSEHVAPDFGPEARAIIQEALDLLSVEVRCGVEITSTDRHGVVLSDGTAIQTHTVVVTAGVRAQPTTSLLARRVDRWGRVEVDPYLQVQGTDRLWAAGDVARVTVDGANVAAMSCQHAIPQGKYAGHNAVSAIAGHDQKRYEQRLYVTCLDLGPVGALVTMGFDRNRVIATGAAGKAFKRYINWSLIYPPTTSSARDLFKAAAPPAGGKAISRIGAAVTRFGLSRRALIRSAPDRRTALAVR